jgi:hypothetical protein
MQHIPEDFIAQYVPKEQWFENYLPGDVFPTMRPQQVGLNPVGRRWGLGPLQFEEYVSDTEPDLSKSDPDGTAPARMIMWQRVFRTDVPPGWHHAFRRTPRLEGVADLSRPQPYWAYWSESAKRYRKRWLSKHLNKTHQVEEVPFVEFAAAYRKSTVWHAAGALFLGKIERKLAGPHPEAISLKAARDIATGEVIAAMAFLHSPAHKSSHYISGFMLAQHKHVPAMVGLVDDWFDYGATRGWRFLSFGEFWMPGKPKSWKGFSQFKAKFGVTYLLCPHGVWRVVRRGKTS